MKKEQSKTDEEKLKEILDSLGGMEDMSGLPKIPNISTEELERGIKMLSGFAEVKDHAELMNWAIRLRFETLSVVSTLAATLLVIATFNDKLIALDNFVRVLLTALLTIIPAGIWCLYYETDRAIKESFDKIQKIVKEKVSKEASQKVQEYRKPTFRGAIPLIMNIAFTVVIILVIVLIWMR